MLTDHDSSKMLNKKYNRKKKGNFERNRWRTTKTFQGSHGHKNIIKECKFIQNLKGESIKPLSIPKRNSRVPLNLVLFYYA